MQYTCFFRAVFARVLCECGVSCSWSSIGGRRVLIVVDLDLPHSCNPFSARKSLMCAVQVPVEIP